MVRLSGVWLDEDDMRTRDDIVMLARAKGFDFEDNGDNLNEAIDKIWAYLTAIRSREDKCQPKEYWYYLGEDVKPSPNRKNQWREYLEYSSQELERPPAPNFASFTRQVTAGAPPAADLGL